MVSICIHFPKMYLTFLLNLIGKHILLFLHDGDSMQLNSTLHKLLASLSLPAEKKLFSDRYQDISFMVEGSYHDCRML